jgi:uncharacterized paraquat-inducible protein A
MKEHKCPDCDFMIQIPDDVKEGELISCSGCGLEFKYIYGELRELKLIEGFDWGE